MPIREPPKLKCLFHQKIIFKDAKNNKNNQYSDKFTDKKPPRRIFIATSSIFRNYISE